MIGNVLSYSKLICKEYIKEGDFVVDATMGKGADTIFLSELVGETGKVYAFDIQQEAYNITKNKLAEKNLINRCTLILDGHENIDKYIFDNNIKAVIYNLGYLPGANHNITTKKENTLISIKKCDKILLTGGIIVLAIYPGHAEGLEEKRLIEDYVTKLDQKQYNVSKVEFINQANNPPVLIVMQKRL